MEKVRLFFFTLFLTAVGLIGTGCAGVDYRMATAQSAGAFAGTAAGGLIANAPGCANLGAIGCQSVANAVGAFTGSVAGQATYANMAPQNQRQQGAQGAYGFNPDPNRNGCGWVMPNGVYVCTQNPPQGGVSGGMSQNIPKISFDCVVNGRKNGRQVFASDANQAAALCRNG
jgi:hypothetical protein